MPCNPARWRPGPWCGIGRTACPQASRNWIGPGFHTVATLFNGHTYALANVQNADDARLFELPATGPARDTGITMRSACQDSRGATKCVMYENGDLGYAIVPSISAALTAYVQSTQYVYRRALTGFDADGNPVWARAQRVASYNARPGGTHHPCYHGAWTGVTGPRFPVIPSSTPKRDFSVILDVKFH